MLHRKNIIAGLILILLLAGGLYYYQRQPKYLAAKPSPATQALQDVMHDIGTKAPIQDMTNWPDWINDQAVKMPLKAADASLGATKNEYMGHITNKSVEEIDASLVKTYQSQVNDAFLKIGFQKNMANTKPEGNEFAIAIDAFEKNDLKCLASYYVQMDPFINILCGVYDTEQAQLQKELRPAILKADDPVFTFNVREVRGDAAIGDVYTSPGGYYWIAVKENGVWKKIHEGQDVPECSLMDSYHIPLELYGGCYDKATDKYRSLDSN